MLERDQHSHFIQEVPGGVTHETSLEASRAAKQPEQKGQPTRRRRGEGKAHAVRCSFLCEGHERAVGRQALPAHPATCPPPRSCGYQDVAKISFPYVRLRSL